MGCGYWLGLMVRVLGVSKFSVNCYLAVCVLLMGFVKDLDGDID